MNLLRFHLYVLSLCVCVSVCICEYKRVCAIILWFFLSFGLIVQHFCRYYSQGIFPSCEFIFRFAFIELLFFFCFCFSDYTLDFAPLIIDKWIDIYDMRSIHAQYTRLNVIMVGKPPNQKEFYDELWNLERIKNRIYT